MPNTQRNMVRTGTVFYKPVKGIEEVRKGCLLKSPPANKFRSLRAWKRRFFVLFKINEKDHVLKYFRSIDDRNKSLGGIDLSQILRIFPSPQTHNKWNWINKTFKCPPNSVLFIRTTSRDYFLIDENNDNVEGWFQDLSKIHLSLSESPLNSEGSESQWEKQGSNRSSSDPVPPLNVSQNASQDSIKDAGLKKSRPMSDPVSKQDFEHHCFQQEENCSSSSGKSTSEPSTTVSPEPLYDTPRNLLRDCQGLQKSRRMSDPVLFPDFSHIMGYGAQQEEVTSSSDKSTSESSTTVSPEPLYDTPRNLLDDWRQGDEKTRRMSEPVSKLDLCHIKNYCSQQEEGISDPVYEEYPFSVIKERCSSVDSSDNEDENQNEEEANSFYMMMEPVYEELNKVQQGNDAIQALPSDTVDESQHPAPPAEKAKVSQADIALNRAKSRALLSSSGDRRTADVKEIYVNQNDLKTHLTLEDLNGKPCVSHWPALPETVCQFRKGDQILAINDLHTESVEDVQTYLKKLLKDQVKLTVLRQPGSEAFLRSRWGTE